MTTVHSYIYVIYSTNPEELLRFLQNLANYIQDVNYAEPYSTKVFLYETCIYIHACFDTVCSGQRAKEESIQEHIKGIQTKLLIDFPSFLVEFYFHHWHLKGFDKKGIFLGKDCFLHKTAINRFSGFQDLGKLVNLTEFFGEGKPNTWTTSMHLPAYIKKYGEVKKLISGDPWAWTPEEPEKCLIDDD
jgi:hypothetical protein